MINDFKFCEPALFRGQILYWLPIDNRKYKIKKDKKKKK